MESCFITFFIFYLVSWKHLGWEYFSFRLPFRCGFCCSGTILRYLIWLRNYVRLRTVSRHCLNCEPWITVFLLERPINILCTASPHFVEKQLLQHNSPVTLYQFCYIFESEGKVITVYSTKVFG